MFTCVCVHLRMRVCVCIRAENQKASVCGVWPACLLLPPLPLSFEECICHYLYNYIELIGRVIIRSDCMK